MNHALTITSIAAILCLGAVGALLGWLSYFRIRALEKDIADLKNQLRATASTGNKIAPDDVEDISAELTFPPTDPDSVTVAPEEAAAGEEPPPDQVKPPSDRPSSVRNINWMVWLGGLSIALAGIFMVRYSIEAGLLGPTARVTLAIITGLVFHGIADWLTRIRGPHPAVAALAGGASITLFGAVLAAQHLYHLASPNVAFSGLAIIAFGTMALSLRQGPVLAAIGLLGAYVVPVLVSTGQGNVNAAMIYALIVSAAGLMLLRYVFRTWLWWGILTGLLGWWLISLDAVQAADFRAIYLAVAAYLLLAVATGDWLLTGRAHKLLDEPANVGRGKLSFLQCALTLTVMAWGSSLAFSGVPAFSLWQWVPLPLVILAAARENSRLRAMPWFSLAVLIVAVLADRVIVSSHPFHISLNQLVDADAEKLTHFAIGMALLYSGLGLLILKTRGFGHHWASLTSLTPLLWLALCYVLTGNLAGSWQWSLATVTAGLGYSLLCGLRLRKQPADHAIIWLTLASHAAYSLAAAMFLREAGLTLALAVQAISLSWLLRRFELPWLHWLIKGVLALVVIRLTFNPWLAIYPSDVHWSLWTYGGSTLCCFLASKLTAREAPIQQWLEAATIHLLVLTLAAETRYWLYDGNLFIHRYSFTEAAINTSLWAALALSYYHRSHVSSHLARIYRWASGILMAAAGASYTLSLTALNPLWHPDTVADRPVFNLLLLAYGLPVILALLSRRLWFPEGRRLAGIIAGIGLLWFVSIEIHHLWQGGFYHHRGIGNGELYTYSAAWLAMAVIALALATLWRLPGLNRGGLLLLAIVIAKIFMVDMSGLEGLLRVASFMGLGLCLLGLAYLRTRLGSSASTHHP